jgi:formamidopyrimidine-DNA glycosylase
MPELPEVETIRRGLEPILCGKRLLTVDLRRKELRFALPERFGERLAGRRVLEVGRRGKYLLVYLDRGEVLVVHLGMTGRLIVEGRRGRAPRASTPRFVAPPSPLSSHKGKAGRHGATSAVEAVEVAATANFSPQGTRESSPGRGESQHGEARHDHVVFTMSDGTRIVYNDARRFGFMTLVPEGELLRHELFRRLGVEPLGASLSAKYLAAAAKGRRTDLKSFLMDQHVVAGLGNIYACEALFRAGLDPRRPARRLATRAGKPTPAAERLAKAIKSVLHDAIGAGGSTLRDYKQADGTLGFFQHSFAVYGRAGAPCSRPGCAGIVRAERQGGRSTFACPVCQR